VIRIVRSVARLHPAWIALAIGLGALVFRIWVMVRYHDDTIGHLVKGVPVYDGAYWDLMSADFAAGAPFSGLGQTGFDSLRPFRWIFMGAIYAYTGPSVAVTQGVNAILGALSALLVFEILRRLTTVPVALLGAGYRAFSLTDARYGLTTSTEPLGGFLSTLFLFLFVVAAQRWDQRRNRLYWLGTGVVFGLANLTRPEVLPMLFSLPVALALVLSRRDRPRPTRRQVVVATLAMCGGFAVATGPWLLRQHFKYGIWQISSNTPEVLYAASSPRYRSWQPALRDILRDGPIHDRVAYFGEGFRKNLHDHLGFYLTNAGGHMKRITERLLSRTPLLVALLLLVPSALASNRALRVLVPAVGLAVALWLIPPPMLCWIWLLAAVVAAVKRSPIVLLAAFAISPIVSLGLTALSGDERLVYSLEWPAFTLAVWLFSVVLGHEPANASEAPDWGRAGLFVRRIAAAAILLMVLGLGKAALGRFGKHEPHEPTLVKGPEAEKWIARALETPAAAPYAALRDRLQVWEATVRPDYVMHFGAGEQLVYWNQLFNRPRRYAFSVLEPVPETYYVLPNGLVPPAGKKLVLIGVPVTRPLYASSFEVVALSTADAGPSESMRYPNESVARMHAWELPR
jgi:4-amino-4-deoxy-L-arabinose transferase-like glycosyltransferase